MSFCEKAQAEAFGLYIHVPFCARKCPYCDFNTYAGLGSLHERTVDALCVDLSGWGERLAGRTVTSVFVGGGTPTLLSEAQLSRLLGKVHRGFTLSRDCEFTVEANPGVVDRDKFQALAALGVNRLSIGVQSFQPDELQFLGRIHGVSDAYAAFEGARAAGFDNVNLDFIFGLPNQTQGGWEDTLAQAVALAPEHLSLYSLIVEPETPLHAWVAEGRVEAPDDDIAGDLYLAARELLAANGYVQYEVSNWATDTGRSQRSKAQTETANPLRACRHNLLYWRNGEYVGIGPGAHSHLRNQTPEGIAISRRWSACRSVPEYVQRIEANKLLEEYFEALSPRESMGETMMLGLRLLQEGVTFQRFAQLHGVQLDDIFARELQRLQQLGLLEIDEERVRLTQRGLMIGNQVFGAFLPDAENEVETAAA